MSALGSPSPLIEVHSDKAHLAQAVAARFVATTLTLLAKQADTHVVLTGGSVGIAVLAAVTEVPEQAGIDWDRVHLWWGDERWVPAGHADRNEQQARDALIDALNIPAGNVHAFPASDQDLTLDDAAMEYAGELAAAAVPGDALPVFDITFLGMGPDGHIASLFPGRTEGTHSSVPVVAVRDSPKPPPERLSLSLAAINSSQRVWLVVGGADKASALKKALTGASPVDIPAVAVAGVHETVFFVDRDAASNLPADLTP